MDFDASIYIITTDGQNILSEEYDQHEDGVGIFVKVTNDVLDTDFGDDNSICIHKDWMDKVLKVAGRDTKHIYSTPNDERVVSQWQIEDKDIPGTFKLNDGIGELHSDEREFYMARHIDGYRANMEVMRNVFPLLDGRTVDVYLPAIMLARHTVAIFDNKTIHGYLPSIGQLIFIGKNIYAINTALRRIDKYARTFAVDVMGRMTGSWWSVTEFNNKSMWILYTDGPSYDHKQSWYMVLPIFTV